MNKVVIIKEEDYDLIIDALEAYLSAGSKEDRKRASIIAKKAYIQLTWKQFKNK